MAAEGPENEIRSALEALERHGLLDWDAERSQVRPGPRLLRFARAGDERRALAALADPAMRRLADESGETVNLMVRAPQGAEAVAQADGRHVLGVSSWVGREVPDHCSAAGQDLPGLRRLGAPAGPARAAHRADDRARRPARARAGGGPPARLRRHRRRARDGAHGGGRTDPRGGRLGRRRARRSPVPRRALGPRGSPSSAAWRSSRPTASRPSSATRPILPTCSTREARGRTDYAGDLARPARPGRGARPD